MKRITIFLILSIFVYSGYSKQIDENTARLVAKSYFNIVLNIKNISSNDFSLADKYIDGESFLKNNSAEIVYLYIFNFTKGKGFIIVSGDDNAEPVLGYSKRDNYNNINLSPSLQYWLDGYKQQIKYITENKVTASEKIKQKWDNLIKGTYFLDKSNKKSSVEPLILTKWNQSPYYNNLCPLALPPYYNNPLKCVTGCVATAMSQIMKYWNFPTHGIGSHGYTHPSYGYLSADFENATYDYANMPDSLSEFSSPEEVEAIATLVYHCGVSVDMDYGMSVSGAWVIYDDNPVCAETSYKTYFSYDSKTIQGLKRVNYTDTDWKDILKNELDNKRPIQYAGWGSGGHTWICVGYDVNDKFYMDWGDGGANNGYFHMDSLSPGNGSNFNSRQEALIGIQPSLQPDIYETNNTQLTARTLPLTWINDTAKCKTTGSNIHIDSDIDYYKISLDAGYNYSISARIHDGKNSGNGNPYSCDVLWSYDKGKGWSINYDDLMSGKISVKGEGSVTFKVNPFNDGLIGTYLLDMNIARVSSADINEISSINNNLIIYPNPVSNYIYLKNFDNINYETIQILNYIGQTILSNHYSLLTNHYSIDISNLSNGIYYIKAINNNDEVFYKKFIINK